MSDQITPTGFDLLLIAVGVPLVMATLLLQSMYSRDYTRFGTGERRSGSRPTQLLERTIIGFALLVVSIALLVRPIVDLLPSEWFFIEQVVAVGSRLIALSFVLAVLWSRRR